MPKKLHFDHKDPTVFKLLRKVETFNNLTDTEIKSLTTILRKQQYKANEIVCREGEIGTTAFVVAEGEFHHGTQRKCLLRLHEESRGADVFGDRLVRLFPIGEGNVEFHRDSLRSTAFFFFPGFLHDFTLHVELRWFTQFDNSIFRCSSHCRWTG